MSNQILKVHKTGDVADVVFKYDAYGHKMYRFVQEKTGDKDYVYTLYSRNSQGEIMATYELVGDQNGSQYLNLKELPIY
ncbi:MAG: hypothetical protein MJK14_27720, partial [Rivularia sp. ALOHA_DT_140]|nr:hypothetical protein [Rivularia sp. ALOHA_DT_140]